MRVTPTTIELDPFTIEDARTVDVRIDGHRVWSTRVPFAENGVIALQWPNALKGYLRGRGRIELADSATSRLLESKEIHLPGSDERIAVTDARGRWLAMTKWDRLGPVLEGRDGETSARLLSHTREVVDLLEAEGHDVYIVGGSLLGVVRQGGMLPHDDDVDLAFLCREENPLDIGLTSYRMERTLTANGFTVVRHSLAHLELEFFTDTGEPDCYVDIFTGFFRDGMYCQPFALRGPDVDEADLVPTRRVTLEGVELPEPASPEAWLAYAYGPGWRVPDPTFRFVTPRSTLQRFETWFGVFNRGRVFWDKHYMTDGDSGIASAGRAVERFLRDVPPGARILDVGCGDGRWTRELTRSGHRVTGVDYSHEALRIAREGTDSSLVEFRYLNVNDRAALFELGTWMLGTGDEWYVFAHHSVQALTRVNRQAFLLFLDLVLRGRGFADVISDQTMSWFYERGRPDTWHLPVDWIRSEIEEHPLAAEVIGRGLRKHRTQPRPTSHVRLTRVPGHVRGGDARAGRLARERRRQENDR